MAKYPPWPDAVVGQVADVLGHTTTGLTGPEIDFLLHSLAIPDPGPITKRYRVRDGLLQRQRNDGGSDRIVTFIVRAMAPVNYTSRPERFSQRRDDLNEVLAFVEFTSTTRDNYGLAPSRQPSTRRPNTPAPSAPSCVDAPPTRRFWSSALRRSSSGMPSTPCSRPPRASPIGYAR